MRRLLVSTVVVIAFAACPAISFAQAKSIDNWGAIGQGFATSAVQYFKEQWAKVGAFKTAELVDRQRSLDVLSRREGGLA